MLISKSAKIIIALSLFAVVIILISRLNFEHGGSLADFQDGLFAKYISGEKITPQELRRLELNKWVSAARVLAPNNMVVRQYCLIDLVRGDKGNKGVIVDLVNKVAPEDVWLEGYSYWLYAKPFLESYDEKFEVAELRKLIKDVDSIFAKTSYKRGDKLYPAPFGDLRDVPLEDSLQYGVPSKEVSVGIITKSGDTYFIKATPLGFNMHTSEVGAEIKIIDGQPENFVFYEGYDKKYKNSFSELIDMLDVRRFLSFFR